MGLRTIRNLALVGFGIASLGALSTVVVGWAQAGSVPFNVPSGMPSNPPIWMGPPGTRVGIKVKVTAGEVRAEGPSTPTPTPLGHVHENAVTVFEGNFPNFNLIGIAASSSGTTTISSYNTLGNTNRLIGGDTLTLPVPGIPDGTSYGVYGSTGAQINSPRLLTVKAGSGDASVTDGTTTLVNVDAGDWSFCSKMTNAYRIASSVATSVDFAIYDMPSAVGSPLWSQSGDAIEQPGDTGDAVYADGNASICITLTNKVGTGDVNVVCAGGNPAGGTVAAGQAVSFTGNISAFSWTYTAPGTTVNVKVAKPGP